MSQPDLHRIFYWLSLLIAGLLTTACAHQQSIEMATRAPASAAQAKDLPMEANATHHSQLDWPVDAARLTQQFRAQANEKKHRPHYGIDLAAPKGTSIFAAQDGVVVYNGKEFKGFGRMILIEGTGGISTIYAHLSKSRVSEGQHIHRGQWIADVGRTGRATGNHLHFEVRVDRRPVDPLEYLPSVRSPASLGQ